MNQQALSNAAALAEKVGPLLQGFTPGAYGIWTLVLMLAGWLTKEWRESRKLSYDDRQAKREGYAKQVENLQGENRALQSDLSTLRREHDDYRHLCQAETDALRKHIMWLEGELAGFKRRLDAQSISAAREMNAPTTIAKLEQLARDAGHALEGEQL